jgi:hypothetical protein
VTHFAQAHGSDVEAIDVSALTLDTPRRAKPGSRSATGSPEANAASQGLMVDPDSAQVSAPALPGDTHADGHVNLTDYTTLANCLTPQITNP